MKKVISPDLRIITGIMLILIIVVHSIDAQNTHSDRIEKRLNKSMIDWHNPLIQWDGLGIIRLDSLQIDERANQVNYFFNTVLSYLPWRSEMVSEFKNNLSKHHNRRVKDYEVQVFTNGYELSQLVPNIYRTSQEVDENRIAQGKEKVGFIHMQGQLEYSQGLSDKLIALWHSHGWCYESKLDRWEWQRARLYGSVEDISPMAYVLPYLVPMLENAGANVFLPRERCLQSNEVIIDNDFSSSKAQFSLEKNLEIKHQKGFAYKDTLFVGDNPFQTGTSLEVVAASGKVAEYKAKVPETGDYAVYVSYQQNQDNSKEVTYKVFHSGGETSYWVNQTMGGGTWIYLGTFHFKSAEEALIEVSGNGNISLDAVRLGGGMGNVARKPSDEVIPNQWSLNNSGNTDVEAVKVDTEIFSAKLSGRPRYMEAARYWLQYAGMPDTLVFSLNDEKNDYNDDYQSRGEWVDYLMGAPNGPTRNRNAEGLNLPIDLAFAFHTDAGITPNDSVIGTLGIFSTKRDDGKFPNGQSKLASRDLADIIQTQIVDDIRALYKTDWTRRGLWDKQYSEAWRPNVPTMLLELLSHQNVADMRYGLDPEFRFDVCRAVYKGMLKFLAFQEGREYVVQPLMVDHLAIRQKNGTYELSWQPVIDSLEPSATPTKYKVYQRINDNGFDNGTIVEGTYYQLPQPEVGCIYSYKVTAINDGGESFASEILSLGILGDDSEKVLVVNAFDRVSAPAFIDEGDFAGVAWWEDQGVPDKFDLAFTGFQYDYNRKSQWLDDDSPGWGASYADYEGKIIKGNTFDNVFVHGQSILKAGYSFVSVSDEEFSQPDYDASKYKAVDIILGEEKTSYSYQDSAVQYQIYTKEFMNKVVDLTKNNQNIFMNGAYVGSDIYMTGDTIVAKFAADVLGFKWRTNHAVKSGNVYATDYATSVFKGELCFNTVYRPDIYTVEAPDAIEAVGDKALTAFRYDENNASAAVLYQGDYKTVIFGFPFETIISEQERDSLMKAILNFLMKNNK
ncbi:hypothetical protein [Carboxylicivirga caseinilyticus]|uniref:golvesin C-terminal-like domain-containing protein n=1 Tax=Carboxylicivirga caseinilyticus TaxID=3417572 RepID=UPI003D34868A|nr:hypothetical protein [Marinilabiliaceae bacterium A049]